MILKTLQRSDLTPDIRALRGGSGPSLVLIHGVGLNVEAWGPMVPHLMPHFALTLIDLPGHGNSAAFSDKSDLVDYTKRLQSALEQIDGPQFVVGHSMGALLTMELAGLCKQKICGIAPLNAIYRRSPEAKLAVQNRAQDIVQSGAPDPKQTLERWFGTSPSGAMKDAAQDCHRWLTTVDPKGYGDAYNVFAQQDGPSDETLKSIDCPSLFMTGAEEPNSTPAMSKDLAASVDRGKMMIIDGAKHMMPMTHADIVSQHIIDFHRDEVSSNG